MYMNATEVILEQLQQLVEHLNMTNSQKDKLRVLHDELNPNTARLIRYVYSPYITFGVTSKSVVKSTVKHETSGSASSLDLFELLDQLSTRTLSGNTALEHINKLIQDHPSYKDLILNIIDKDLKIRLGATLFNKVFDVCGYELIPSFSVALCNKYDEKLVDDYSEWYASRKLDGCRCIVIKDGTNVKAYSRQGKEFETLSVLLDDIRTIPMDKVVFDGEICIVDEQGNEDFQTIMKYIKRKNYTIPHPMYKVFDMMTCDDFNCGFSLTKFSIRYLQLSTLMNGLKLQHVSLVKQERLKNKEDLAQKMLRADEQGWEGLVIRRDVGYEGLRTKNMLKVKNFYDDEYEVIGVETGTMRVLSDGVMTDTDVMTNVIINHKGYQVSVGSGFTIEQRQHYFKHPEDIIGKMITVKYFEETKNQHDGISLRFPTVKYIYEHGRSI